MTCSGLVDSLRRAESAQLLRDMAKEQNDEFRLELLLSLLEKLDGEKA